jgi:hypothetical protein
MFESISHAEASTGPVGCAACDLSPGLIANDPAGLYGWAWCPSCEERWFIPWIAEVTQGYGVDLMFSIDTTGPRPILMEVTS